MATSKKNTPKLFVFDDETKGKAKDDWYAPVIDGEVKGHGLVPRDYSKFPPEMFDPPRDLKLFPRSDWSQLCKDCDRQKTFPKYLREVGAGGQPIPSLDQNGQGYCWFYSNTSSQLLARAAANLPYVRLSAHAGAWKIKNGRDEGGWCGLSAKFYGVYGCPTTKFWPEKSMSRQYDTPETWANAKLHTVSETWIDLTRDVYDQNLTFEQLATVLFCGQPCAVDFNWWSHSVCAVRVVEVEPGSYGLEIWNSWSDGWGDRGMGILRGSKAIPDGAVCLRVPGISVA